MAEAVITETTIRKLLARLPAEQDSYEDIQRRVRIRTADGRTFYAFVRAGAGRLSFAGWEQTAETKPTDEWEYFVIGAPRPGDPLQLVRKDGPLGVIVEAEMEERAS